MNRSDCITSVVLAIHKKKNKNNMQDEKPRLTKNYVNKVQSSTVQAASKKCRVEKR